MKVLIVDDEKKTQFELQRLLKERKYEVCLASSGADALTLVREERFDVLLSDLLLFGLNGFELWRSFRECPGLRSIPVGLYSSVLTDADDEAIAIELGARFFIRMPCDPAAFFSGIEGARNILWEEGAAVPSREEGERLYEACREKLLRRLKRKTRELQESLQISAEAERKARTEAEKWRDALHRMPDGVAFLDEGGTVMDYNPSFAKTFGREGETLIGMKCYQLVHRAENHIDGCPLVRSLRSQERETLEMSVGEKTFLAVTDPLLTPDAKVSGFVHILRDITRHKRVEKALKRSEERIRTLTERSLQALFIFQDFRIRYANAKAAEVAGCSIDELLSLPPERVKALVHPEDQARVWGRFRERLEGKDVPPWYEFRGFRKDGSMRWFEIYASPIEYRRKPAIMAAIMDVTERRRAEERLREMSRIINRSPAVAFVWRNEEGWPVEFVSDNVKDVFGYTAEEFMGGRVSYEAVIHPEDLHRVREEVLRYSTGEGQTEFMHEPYRIVDREGKVKWVDDRTNIRRDEKGTITHYEGIVLDITERKRSEEEMASLQDQLRHAQKMEAVGRLAGGIAHDFNNVLTVIKGSCELSLLDLRAGDPLYENLKEIERCADRAARLTQQLLAFSRKQIMAMRVINLNTVIEDLRKILQRILGEDVELLTYLDEGAGRIKADPGQLEQVILNLVINARDAMPRGGRLTIETAAVELDKEYAKKHLSTPPGPYTMLSISDTGVGMAPDVLERIFEPFFTTKEAGKGTGLGLSTVYGIVKQSGGSIWVYSEVGKGTTFKIYFPRVDEPLDEGKEAIFKEIPQGSETILVVEDEEVVRKLASRLLKRQGYKVLEASDGGKAFMLCEQYPERIDLILSDVVMPGMSGRELVERLQKIHPEAKALYMSGYTDNVIVDHGILEKGIDFVQKPFTLESLARKVREVLEKRNDER